MRTLFARLSLVFLAILLVLGFVTLWLANRSSQNYLLEFTQKLNRPIAMYMAENMEWVVDGELDTQALERLAPHIMIINPSVEVYLLDAKGKVLWPRAENTPVPAYLHRTSLSSSEPATLVSMDAIKRFLQEDNVYPLLGSHPERPGEHTIFSAWPIFAQNAINTSTIPQAQPLGYIYVVLASEKHRTLFASIHENYSIRAMLITLGSVLALTLCGGLFIFFMLTRRLRLLASDVYNAGILPHVGQPENIAAKHQGTGRSSPGHFDGDEIDLLANNYKAMTDELLNQYRRLEQGDVSRREFIASISHDLRTPLTSLQNYLETVIAKWSSMSRQQHLRFVGNAHKQTLRLQHLITRLFEISKLNSPDFTLQRERFSMLELAFDCAQDFELSAQRKQVTIRVKASLEDSSVYEVFADIGLIQRVLENLLANAVRHTPANGTIEIALKPRDDASLHVQVENTGCTLSAEQIASFSANGTCKPEEKRSGADSDGAGFGLSIVQRILQLHGSRLDLEVPAERSGDSNRLSINNVCFGFILERA